MFFQFTGTDATDTGTYDSYVNGRYADTIELPVDQSTAVGQSLVSFLAAPLLVIAAGLMIGARRYDYSVVKIGAAIAGVSAACVFR